MNRLLIVAAFCWMACDENEPAHHHHSTNTRGDYADSVNKKLITQDTMKGSPERIAMDNIGKCHVHIEYSSPGVKGRIIWGGLVPYDQVWVTGAHAATTVNFSKDVRILGKPIKAGIYAFFTIPGKDRWTVILNSRYDQHLTDEYNAAEDVARWSIAVLHAKKPVERLTYLVLPEAETMGHIVMKWEHVVLLLPVTAPN
jgi:hypothetical protein